MRLQLPEHVVMIVVGRQLHPQFEARRFQESHQRRQRRLATVMLVGGHHGPGHAGTLGQLRLAQAGLQPRVSQQTGARGGLFVVDAHVHDCIPQPWRAWTQESLRSTSVCGSSYGTAQPGDRQRAQLFAFLQDSSSPIGVSGCGRLSPAVCGEYARKLSMEGTFSLVSALSPMVCKSIARASKVRILHLPPRAEEAPDLRKRGQGPSSCTRWGYPKCRG